MPEAIRFTKTIDRAMQWPLMNGVSADSIGKYISQLEGQLVSLDKMYRVYDVDDIFGISRESVDELKRLLDEELEYARFYFAYRKRQKTEPDFDKWVLYDHVDTGHYYKPKFTGWKRANGKIEVIIELESTGAMTKVSLSIENDAQDLYFVEKHENIDSTHLRNPDSIKDKVEEYKAHAEKLFADHQWPRYCKDLRRLQTLKEMLHVNGGPE